MVVTIERIKREIEKVTFINDMSISNVTSLEYHVMCIVYILKHRRRVFPNSTFRSAVYCPCHSYYTI